MNAKATSGHGAISSVGGKHVGGPIETFLAKQTAAKPFMSTADCVCTIAAWSDFEDSAVKASATTEKPTSNRQLPRRDWQ